MLNGGAAVPLWSFPGVVTTVDNPHVAVTLDLGCCLYYDTLIRVVDVAASGRNMSRLTDLLPAGTRIVATAPGASGTSIRAHLTLPDGGDVASTVRGRRLPAAPTPQYGATLNRSWTYPAVVERVTDGDTLHARLDVGVAGVTYRTAIRVAHVNAPEKNTAEGQAALVWAERVLTPGLPITVHSHELDKYRRVLGAVQLPDNSDYGTELVTAGHAVPYEGGARG